MKLDVVEIFVENWAKMVAWYQKVLGLKVLVKEDDDRFAMLKGEDGAILALFESELVGNRVGNVVPNWHVESIEKSFRRLKTHGVRFLTGVEKTHWGKQAKFVDPEGNQHLLYEEKRDF